MVYTGTHDNETVVGWLDRLTEKEMKHVRDYICDHETPDDQLYWRIIAEAMKSSANICIIPAQDYLGLDNNARMNQPSTLSSNWSWRMKDGAMTGKLKDEILTLTKRYGRFNWDSIEKESIEEE